MSNILTTLCNDFVKSDFGFISLSDLKLYGVVRNIGNKPTDSKDICDKKSQIKKDLFAWLKANFEYKMITFYNYYDGKNIVENGFMGVCFSEAILKELDRSFFTPMRVEKIEDING